MAVSLSGSSLTLSTIHRASAFVVVMFAVFCYLYGPAASPTLHDAAVQQCNTHAGGNFRSYRLTWNVGVYPHWTCTDASRPAVDPVSLGWWTSPF